MVAGSSEYRWEVSEPYEIISPNSSDPRVYQGSSRTITVRFPSSNSVTNGWIRAAAISGGTCSTVGNYQTLDIIRGPQTFSITGPSSVARTTVNSFSIPGPNLSNFSWSTPSGLNILSGASTYRIVTEALSTGSGTIYATYRSCGVLKSASKYVTITGNSGGGPGFGGFARNAPMQEEIGLSPGSLYPNPATDQVTLTAEKPLQQVVVVNIMGQVLKTLNDVSGTTASIDVDDLEAGSYFVIAQDEGGMHTYQLVVE